MTSLAIWTLCFALAFLATGGAAASFPESTAKVLVRLPRSIGAGRVFCALALGWAGWMFYQAPLEFVLPYRHWIPWLTPAIILAAWILMPDLLAGRAFGGLLVLVPTPLLAAVRAHPSAARMVMAVLAYLMALKGMVLLMSPYWMRRGTAWLAQNPVRTRATGIGAMVIGLGLLALALAIY